METTVQETENKAGHLLEDSEVTERREKEGKKERRKERKKEKKKEGINE